MLYESKINLRKALGNCSMCLVLTKIGEYKNININNCYIRER